MGMTAKQLIAMLASDGWQKTEKKLDAEGFDGSYTADDVVACAKFCWGVPDRIVKHRPEIIKQFASRDIIDIAGAGRSGLAALRAIFKADGEDLPELYLAKDQLETLFNHLRTVPQGITMSDHHGQTFIKGLMGKIYGNENVKAAFLAEVDQAVQKADKANRDLFEKWNIEEKMLHGRMFNDRSRSYQSEVASEMFYRMK